MKESARESQFGGSPVPESGGVGSTGGRRRRRRPPVVPLLVGAMLLVVGYRVWQGSEEPRWGADELSSSFSAAELKALYGEPGGAYTRADIEANGRVIPAEKYRGFQARHSVRTQPGDPLCPITRTLAHAGCTWVVAGERYAFCCPPCIDEFVRLAKEQPEAIAPAAAYVQR